MRRQAGWVVVEVVQEEEEEVGGYRRCVYPWRLGDCLSPRVQPSTSGDD